MFSIPVCYENLMTDWCGNYCTIIFWVVRINKNWIFLSIIWLADRMSVVLSIKKELCEASLPQYNCKNLSFTSHSICGSYVIWITYTHENHLTQKTKLSVHQQKLGTFVDRVNQNVLTVSGPSIAFTGSGFILVFWVQPCMKTVTSLT